MKPQMTRKKVTAAELHALLEREFRNSAADLCLKCKVPKPVFIDAKSGANWRVATLDECGTMCHSIFQDIVDQAAEKYDLKS
jgi:hypothetical protein